MNSLPFSDTTDRRRWLRFAGLAAVPLYVLPVGVWGLKGVRPRVLRSSVSTAIVLGALSLLGLGLRSFAGRRRSQHKPALPVRQRWKLPVHGDLMPEEFAASAASGH